MKDFMARLDRALAVKRCRDFCCVKKARNQCFNEKVISTYIFSTHYNFKSLSNKKKPRNATFLIIFGGSPGARTLGLLIKRYE